MGVSGPWPRRTQDGSCYAGLVRQRHATSVAPQAMTLNLQRRKCILAMAGSVATKTAPPDYSLQDRKMPCARPTAKRNGDLRLSNIYDETALIVDWVTTLTLIHKNRSVAGEGGSLKLICQLHNQTTKSLRVPTLYPDQTVQERELARRGTR